MISKHKFFKNKKLKALLKKYNNIEKELRKKEYIKGNKIVSDLGEFFVRKSFKGMKEPKSQTNKGWDFKDKYGKRVQVKTRRLRPESERVGSPHFRPFHTKDRKKDFDYALFVILDLDYWIEKMVEIPYNIIKESQKEKKTDSIELNEKIMNHKRVKCYKFY